MQHNTARTSDIMHSCLETAVKQAIDFVLIQELSIRFENNIAITVSHSAYYCILSTSSDNIRLRVAVFARKLSNYKFCHRTDLTSDSDIIIIDVSGSNIKTFQIINIYNEKNLNTESDISYTAERSLQYIDLTMKTLVTEDFNAHHSWWNSSITSSKNTNSLISWLKSNNFELVNESDIQTCSRSNNSVINLAFITKKLYSQVSDWCVDEINASESDHEIIVFNIRIKATELIDNSLCSDFFNFNKADWKLFSEEILVQAQDIDFSYLHSDCSCVNDLNFAAKTLYNIIYAAAEKSISKRRFSDKSKSW